MLPTLLLLLLPLASAASRPPNIILLLADDLGYGDLGYLGHPTTPTPHIDRLARRGRPLSQYYSGASICSPARGALLTGRYPVSTWEGTCQVTGI